MKSYNHILTFTIDRPDPGEKLLLNTLQQLEKQYLKLPCTILQSAVDAIEIVYTRNLTQYENHTKQYEKLLNLKQKLPPIDFLSHIAYFPYSWQLKNVEQSNQSELYKAWNLSPAKQPVTIQIKENEVLAQIVMDKTIGFYFTKRAATEQTIVHAHAIYACCAAYPDSTIAVAINPQYKHYKELCLYIRAFERMADCLTNNSFNQLSISLKDEVKSITFSEEELREGIRTITQNIPDFMALLNDFPKRSTDIVTNSYQRT